MSVLGWVLLALVCWASLALVIGLFIGRIVRVRNAQRPRAAGQPPSTPATPDLPTPAHAAPDEPADEAAHKRSTTRGLDG